MRRQFFFFFLSALILAGLAGCSGKQSEAAPRAGNAASAGPIFQNLNLAWYINYDWYSAYRWADKNGGEKWMKSQYGINITFMDAGGAASRKLATMLIDDEYPDIITLDRSTEWKSLIDAGVVLPLDEYLDKYTNLRKYIGDPVINLLRHSDGKLYGYPNWAGPLGQLNGNNGYKLQKKYHDALGAPPLDTLDDLYAYLTLLKKNYPAVIPMEVGSGFQGLNNIYGAFAPEYYGYHGVNLYRDGAAIKSVLEDPIYRKALLFANKLYREQLINQDTFTETVDQLRERVRNGQFGILSLNGTSLFQPYILNADQDLRKEDPSTGLFTINPIRADKTIPPEKVLTNTSSNSGWNINVITKSAKDPEAIFACLDWMFGNEGQLAFFYGEPGKYWVPGAYSDEGYPLKMTDDFYAASPESIDTEYSDANWTGNTAFADNFARYIYDQTGKATPTKLDQFTYTFNHSVDRTELTDIVPPGTTDMGVLYQTINDIYRQAIPTILMAPSEERCGALIDRYIAELKNSGLQTLLDYQSRIIFDNLRRLGKQ